MTISAAEDGCYKVSGSLRFETVTSVWKEASGLFQNGKPVSLDLGEVDRADSAGLALLIAWMREARQRGVEVHFSNVPEQLQAIARAGNLEHLLP